MGKGPCFNAFNFGKGHICIMKGLGYFILNDIKVFPTLHQIEVEGSKFNIEPKLMQVLMYLVEHNNRVVPKQELIAAVWGEVIVVEKVLTRAISQLRKHFKDNAEAPHIIATVSKSGYQLIAEPIFPSELKPGIFSFLSTNKYWLISLILLFSVLSLALVYGIHPFNNMENRQSFSPSPLTSYYSWEYDPALSPDENYLAFVWNGMNTVNWNIKHHNTESWGIYLKSMADDSVFVFSDLEGSEGSPVWSSDSKHLIFYQVFQQDSSRLLMKSLKEKGPLRSLISIKARHPDLAWSTDGKFLAFNEKSDQGDTYHISILSLITLEKEQYTFPSQLIWGDHQVSFSPDGRFLAFTRAYSEGIQEIWLLNLSSKKSKQISRLGGNIYGHHWTADGQSIIFSSNKNGRSELLQVEISDFSMQPFLPGVQASNPQLEADKVIFEKWYQEVNIWRLSLLDDSFIPFIASTFWDLHPSFSPDGRKIAFSSNRSGHYEIWTKDFDSGLEKQLSHFQNSFISSPRWAPDNNSLAFEKRIEGQSDIYEFDLRLDQARPITAHPSDDLHPTFSTDGQKLFFSSDRGGSWEIWCQSLVSDSLSQITTAGGYGPQLRDSTDLIYFNKFGQEGIWEKNLENGSEQLLITNLSYLDWGNWVLTSEGIYYIIRKERPENDLLFFYSFGDQSQKKILELEDRLPQKDPSLALSPDGKVLLIGLLNRSSCDIQFIEIEK